MLLVIEGGSINWPLSRGLATVPSSTIPENEELSMSNHNQANKNAQRDCSDWTNEHENTVHFTPAHTCYHVRSSLAIPRFCYILNSYWQRTWKTLLSEVRKVSHYWSVKAKGGVILIQKVEYEWLTSRLTATREWTVRDERMQNAVSTQQVKKQKLITSNYALIHRIRGSWVSGSFPILSCHKLSSGSKTPLAVPRLLRGQVTFIIAWSKCCFLGHLIKSGEVDVRGTYIINGESSAR